MRFVSATIMCLLLFCGASMSCAQSDSAADQSWTKGRISTFDAFTIDFLDLRLQNQVASFLRAEDSVQQTIPLDEVLRIEDYRGTRGGEWGLIGALIGGATGAFAVSTSDFDMDSGSDAAFIAGSAAFSGLIMYVIGRSSEKYEEVYRSPVLDR